MKRTMIFALMILLASLSTGVASATDVCPGSTEWTYMGPVNSSYFASNNPNNTSLFAARAEAIAACSQAWNWASNHVSEVSSWWPEVTAGSPYWQYRCKVCITGRPPRWAEHHTLRRANITMQEAIDRATDLVPGIAMSATIKVGDNSDLGCELQEEPSQIMVVVAEDMVMRQVAVDIETGEATLVR